MRSRLHRYRQFSLALVVLREDQRASITLFVTTTSIAARVSCRWKWRAACLSTPLYTQVWLSRSEKMTQVMARSRVQQIDVEGDSAGSIRTIDAPWWEHLQFSRVHLRWWDCRRQRWYFLSPQLRSRPPFHATSSPPSLDHTIYVCGSLATKFQTWPRCTVPGIWLACAVGAAVYELFQERQHGITRTAQCWPPGLDRSPHCLLRVCSAVSRIPPLPATFCLRPRQWRNYWRRACYAPELAVTAVSKMVTSIVLLWLGDRLMQLLLTLAFLPVV